MLRSDSQTFAVSMRKFNGYIQVFLDGGLNQQKMGVSNITNEVLSGPFFGDFFASCSMR